MIKSILLIGIIGLFCISSGSAISYSPSIVVNWTIPGTGHTQPDLIITTDNPAMVPQIELVDGTFPNVGTNVTYIGYNSTYMFYEEPLVFSGNKVTVPVEQVMFIQPTGLITG